jgi:hypothetical protein
MRPRRRSPLSRALEFLPVVGVLGLCVVVVFIAMNVMVSAAPLAIDFSSASPTASLESALPGSPSIKPLPPTPEAISPPPSASLPAYRPTIVNSVVRASDPNHVWTVYLGYPAFLAGTTPWADLMNADVRTEMETRAEQWEQGPAGNVQVPGKANVLSGSFKTELLTAALASFTLTWVDDSSALPPTTALETISYDLSTGQRILIDQVFTDTDAALAVMSQAARAQLKAQQGVSYDDALVQSGTIASRANFSHWAISPAGIKITFDQRQVSDNPTDMPAVVVPWADLWGVMVRTGPIATLAGLVA